MQQVCSILEQLVAEGHLAGYALGGATAAGLHGEPLATRDIDVFVLLEPSDSIIISLEPLYQRLRALGFSDFEEEGLLIHDYPVQFLVPNSPLESETLKNSLVMEADGHRVRVMRPEYLAAIALTVGRPKDRARLVYLAELPQFQTNLFEDILTRHNLLDRWQQWSASLGLDTKR